MKNRFNVTLVRLFEIIALVAVIGFSMAGCDNGTTSDGNNNPGSTDNGGSQTIKDITAAQLVANIKIGWNLGNTLDAYNLTGLGANPTVTQMETGWGNPVTTKAMITTIKNAGFNAIRIPVSWTKAASGAPNYTIRADWMARVVEVVNYAVDNDMYIILNTHHDEDVLTFMNSNAAAGQAAFKKLWEQIADTFKDYNEKLIFEGLNEPRTPGSSNEWSGGTPEERNNLNSYYPIFVNTVRNSGGNNNKRILIINAYAASAEASVMNALELPADSTKNKLIVSFHSYSPYDFALNTDPTKNSWNKNNSGDTSPITGPIDRYYTKFVSQGIPVIIGEFGAMNKNNEAVRAQWAEYYVNYARSKGIKCFWWDNGVTTGDGELFGLLNRQNNTFTYNSLLNGMMSGTGGGGDTAVTFNSVTANGSASSTTTQLTLTFNQAITGLSAADITLSGISGVNKGTLSGSGPTYTLPISGFTAGGNLNVAISKTGYTISGSPKTAIIYYYSGTTPNPQHATPLYSKWPFYVGAAVPGEAFTSSNGQYPLLGHFNVLVAENDMKPESVMPNEWQNWQSSPSYNVSNAYRWTEADKLVNYAVANTTKIRGHVLFWHEQTPGVFFKTGNLTSAYVSKEVFYNRMEQHVKTVFQKYGGKVLWWDLANETVGDDGNPRVTGGANIAGSDGKSGFTAVMEASGLTGDNRYEWIVNAFKYARKYADENGGQSVKLFLTEYDIEKDYASVKRNGFLRLLDYLITNGAPIDGVGIQGHTRVQESANYVSGLGSLIDQIAAKKNPVNGKNLVVQVTELDISLYAYDDTSLTLSSSELNSRLQTQTTMYRDLFDMFNDKYKAGKFEMVLVWGIDDGHSWMNDFPKAGRTDYPLLFDRQYQPKAAYNSLITGPNTGSGGGETVVGSYSAYASNPYISLSSSVNYQIVNLPSENRTNVLKVVNPGEWAVALYDLTSSKGQNKTITFSAQVKRVGMAGTLNWQINNSNSPSVGTPITNAAVGTWHTMSGTWTGTPTAEYPSFYLSTYENNSASTTYYISNFTITVN